MVKGASFTVFALMYLWVEGTKSESEAVRVTPV
jgi:hypothetical protein